MLLTPYEKHESVNALKTFLKYSALVSCVIFIQQSYARSHQGAIEQPVGLPGIAEFYFRHPEMFFGLHFQYPISPMYAPDGHRI